MGVDDGCDTGGWADRPHVLVHAEKTNSSIAHVPANARPTHEPLRGSVVFITHGVGCKVQHSSSLSATFASEFNILV
jgi:hypothetical protein